MVVVLLGVLFILAGIGAIYFGRGTTGFLVLGVILLVVGVIIIFLGLRDGNSDGLEEGKIYVLSRS